MEVMERRLSPIVFLNMNQDYLVKAEKEFEELQENYYNAERKRRKMTGCQDVVQLMHDKPEKIWWASWEFIGRVNSKGDFLSHRAPARASDLAIHNPELVEDRKISRFSYYR